MPEEQRPQAIDKMMSSPVAKLFTRANALVYRASKGKLWGQQGKAELLLLTTEGRRSHKPRTVPLVHLKDGERFVVAASKMGHPTHPQWYLNLQANPRVQVQVKDRTRTMLAHTAEGEERDRLWRELCGIFSDYERYQRWTDRQIPVVVLTPAN